MGSDSHTPDVETPGRPRRPSVIRQLCLLLVLLPALACEAPRDQRAAEPVQELRIAPETRARADVLHELAKAHEPALTQALQSLTRSQQARLHGLSHRFKTTDSLARKIQTRMDAGQATRPDQVDIEDALRYTILIEDDPKGHYDSVARHVLESLEALGHEVKLVKNYWPRGDTYAGLNCVLAFADGFPWELQFHTIGSLAAIQEGHGLYEVLRLPGTPRGEKQRLFDKLTTRWDWVLVPEGILVPGSVHPKEVLRTHKRP